MTVVKTIGLSGPSSSGKTTMAYLLQHVFPNIASILHAGDFCKEFDQIPTVNGYLDCDGPDAVNYEKMAEVLDHMKGHDGTPPADFKSWQDEVFPGQGETTLRAAPETLVESLKAEVQKPGLDLSFTKLVFLDRFLLFQNPDIRKRLDLRLFFRLSHDVAKERRMKRQGYGQEAKPNEFWKTEDYFEKMVWRCYKEQHSFFLPGGDVEGQVDEVACEQASIKVMPGLDVPVSESLTWSTHQIFACLRS